MNPPAVNWKDCRVDTPNGIETCCWPRLGDSSWTLGVVMQRAAGGTWWWSFDMGPSGLIPDSVRMGERKTEAAAKAAFARALAMWWKRIGLAAATDAAELARAGA